MAWRWLKRPKLVTTELNNKHCCVWLNTHIFIIVISILQHIRMSSKKNLELSFYIVPIQFWYGVNVFHFLLRSMQMIHSEAVINKWIYCLWKMYQQLCLLH
jgi:hypothetical protein